MLRFSNVLFWLFVASYTTFVGALDFNASKWIWTQKRDANGSVPLGNVTFRREFTPTHHGLGLPVIANTLIAADNTYTLYANGVKVGTSGAAGTAQRYCIPLLKGCNVFAVSAENTLPRAAGLLVALQIKYPNGVTETFISDDQWRAVPGTPAGFEQIVFDDSKWPAAFVEGGYPGTAETYPQTPMGTLQIPPEGESPELSLQPGSWIWTNETSNSTAFAPVGARAFRKTVLLPHGQRASQAKILIVVDDGYTLYLNGLLVGSRTSSWNAAQRYVVNFPPTSKIVIAVYAVNSGGPAGLLASAQLVTWGCSAGSAFATDASWKYSIGTPTGFVAPDFDDSAWPDAQVKGKPGVEPWGVTTVPADNSPQSAGILGAPTAAFASVVV
ncbi:hypothetical protein FPV67DRAFT_1575722 [Lyophyllum atratum]|nr:hypothetical protein FPV67DRAFT_1575722 [Lyophyllum atratum]